jgi:tRNA(Arg) A34 adenosine deaminase TadA
MSVSRRDARFVRLAAEEAKKSSVGMQHGCIAVTHGKVVARSFNTACHVSPTVWWSCHAEMSALKKIGEQQSSQKRQRITLYVVRTTPHGGLHASAPCWHCTHAIRRCPCIKRIIYSEADGSITRCTPDKYFTQHVSWGLRCAQRDPA